MNDTGCTAAIATDAAPAPVSAYSQGRIAGSFVLTAGLRPLDQATRPDRRHGRRHPDQPGDQPLPDSSPRGRRDTDRVVKVTAQLQNLQDDFPEFDRVFRSRSAEPFQARTAVGFTLADIPVEINVVALAG